MKDKRNVKEQIVCLVIICFMLLFPILNLFLPAGTVLEVFVNFDGLTIGDNVAAEGYYYEIKDTFDASIKATGYTDAEGYAYFYPTGEVSQAQYKIYIYAHGDPFGIVLGDGSQTTFTDINFSPWVIDAELLWFGAETPVVSELVDLMKWNGTNWNVWASLTTDALGNVDFFVNDGLFSFYPGVSDVNILHDTPTPIIDTYFISSIFNIVSILAQVVILFYIGAQLYYLGNLRRENLDYLLSKININKEVIRRERRQKRIESAIKGFRKV